jgi:hypothetical protein
VLTIGKLGRSEALLEYFIAQVAAGVEDFTPVVGSRRGAGAGAGPMCWGCERGSVLSDAGSWR